LTHYSLYFIFDPFQSKFLIRQAKREEPDAKKTACSDLWFERADGYRVESVRALQGNQAANRESQHQSIVSRETGLFDSLSSGTKAAMAL
jgi:hypothetical protein